MLARFARNERLFNACYLWAFASLAASPGARAYYDLQRRGGKTHNQALRALANRLVAFFMVVCDTLGVTKSPSRGAPQLNRRLKRNDAATSSLRARRHGCHAFVPRVISPQSEAAHGLPSALTVPSEGPWRPECRDG